MFLPLHILNIRKQQTPASLRSKCNTSQHWLVVRTDSLVLLHRKDNDVLHEVSWYLLAVTLSTRECWDLMLKKKWFLLYPQVLQRVGKTHPAGAWCRCFSPLGWILDAHHATQTYFSSLFSLSAFPFVFYIVSLQISLTLSFIWHSNNDWEQNGKYISLCTHINEQIRSVWFMLCCSNTEWVMRSGIFPCEQWNH